MVTRFPRWAMPFNTPVHCHTFFHRTVNGPCMPLVQPETVVPHALSPDS